MGLLDKIAGGIKDVVSDIGDKFDEAKTGGADWWYGENSVLDDMFDPLEKVTGFNPANQMHAVSQATGIDPGKLMGPLGMSGAMNNPLMSSLLGGLLTQNLWGAATQTGDPLAAANAAMETINPDAMIGGATYNADYDSAMQLLMQGYGGLDEIDGLMNSVEMQGGDLPGGPSDVFSNQTY